MIFIYIDIILCDNSLQLKYYGAGANKTHKPCFSIIVAEVRPQER